MLIFQKCIARDLKSCLLSIVVWRLSVVRTLNKIDLSRRMTQGFDLQTKSRIRYLNWRYEFQARANGFEWPQYGVCALGIETLLKSEGLW